MTYSKFKKTIASVLIAALIAPNLVHIDFSYGDNLKKEHDLVVLLVEKDLFETGNENNDENLSGKIYRYANDIRLKSSNTKTKIIRVNQDDHPAEITKLLEKYYLEGEEDSGKTEINKLKGVVLIGEIPFPVVQYKEYYLPTVFPYTDFVDPAFVWDEQSLQFKQNSQSLVPQAEIWHGIIKAPEAEDKTEELKNFFDKNHAFHTGKAASKFDQRVFYADVLSENEKVNSSVLENYFLRNEYTEDLAYLRYNKHFAERVLDKFSKNTFPSYGIDDDGDGQIDEDPINLIDDDGDGQIDEDAGDIYKNVDNDGDGLVDEDEDDDIDNDGDGQVDEDISMSPFSGDAISGLPDIYTKTIIENFLSPYAEVVENYVEKMNTFVAGSGRWTKQQIDSFPALITKLDSLFLESNAPPSFNLSLKNMNTHMENALNQLVENSWQKDVTIVSSISVEKPRENTTEIIVYDNFVNGTSGTNILNVEDCALAHGSPQIQGINLAEQVEYNRLYDPQTAGDPSSACDPYGDCCGNNYTSPENCNPDNAYKTVKHIAANAEKTGIANALACKKYNFFQAQNNTYPISGYTTQTFSSVFKHDEPRNETIMNAVSNPNVNPNIPSDDPRYVSFQNAGSRITNINYFNFFKIKNLSQTNDLTKIKELVEENIAAYSKYVNTKITEENIDTFKEYLYRKISFYKQDYGINTDEVGQPTLSINPSPDFENNYTDWKNQTFTFLSQKLEITDGLSALTQYLKSGQTNHDSDLNSIFKTYFDNVESMDFISFIKQEGASLNLSKSYSKTNNLTQTGNAANSSPDYTLEEIKYQVQKNAQLTNQGTSYSITYTDNFPTTDYLTENYWLDQVQLYGEEDVYKVIQWLNATLDEKRQIIFENYLNQVEPPYPSSAENGYESAYLRTEGSLDYIDLSVEKTASADLEKNDADWSDFLSQNQTEEEEEFSEIMQSAMEDECGSFTEGVDIWEWPSSIACWLGNLGGSSTSSKCSSGDCSSDEQSEIFSDQAFVDIQQTDPEIQIFLSSEQPTLPAYNSLQKVFVYATSDVELQSLELAISQTTDGMEGEIVGENPVQLVDGQGSTYVKSLNPNSQFVVYVKNQDNYKSNTIQFLTTVDAADQYKDNSEETVLNSVETEVIETSPVLDLETLVSQQGYQLAFLNPPKHINYNSDVTLYLELQNADGEAVTSDLQVSVELTPFSEKYAYLKDSNSLDFAQGTLQSITLKTLRETGSIHLLVNSPNSAIASTGLEVKVGNLFTKEDISNLKPQALYTTLLGESYADLIQNDTVANRFLFSLGKTQAVTTLQGNTENYPVAANVYPNGRIEVFDDNYQALITSLTPLQITVFDQANLQKEFSYEVGFQGETINLGEYSYAIDLNNEGVYIGLLEEDLLEIEQNESEIILQTGSEEILKITKQGEFSLNSNYQLTVNSLSVNNLFLNVLFEDETIANVVLVQSQLKQVLQNSTNVVNFFAEANTKGKTGYSILNTNVEKQKMHLGSAESLVSTKTKKGVGWVGDYKNELLFAANNSVGKSTQNYASIFEVLLGDPTVKIKETTTPSSNGFNQTVGKQILTEHNKEIVNTLKLEFNNDNYVDLGLVYSDGNIGLLQGTQNNEFENKGNLVYLADSVLDSQSIDFKDDNYEDILVVTPKNKLILLQNENQELTKQEIKLNLNSNITKFELAQMTNDQNLDLVTALSNGDIMIFYGNPGGVFTETGVLVDQLGGKISAENLATEVLLNYKDMSDFDSQYLTELEISQEASSGTTTLEEFADLTNFVSQNNNIEIVQPENESEKIFANFISGDQVITTQVDKRGKNLNGEFIDIGHTIEYITTLQSLEPQDEIKLTGFISSNFDYISNSLQVNNCGENVNFENQVYSNNYPFLITNIDLEPASVCEIKYKVTVTQTPQINLWIQDVAVGTYAKDEKLDIGLNIEGNTTGKIKYLISQEPGSHEYIEVYTEKEDLDVPDEVNNTDSDGNGIPDRIEKDADGDGVLDYISDYQNGQSVDSDGDGLPDSWDTSDENEDSLSLSGLTASLENVVSFLEGGCDGGCLNIPINYAFFAPGPILGGALGALSSRLGIPVGAQLTPPLVTPIFAWGHYYNAPVCITSPYCVVTIPQPVWLPLAPYSSMVGPMCQCSGGALIAAEPFSWMLSLGRIYLSPTLTGGLGLAVCTGISYPFGKCFATALDSITGSLCDIVGLSGNDAKSNSNDTVSTSGQSLFSVGAGASNSQSGSSGGYSIEFDLDSFSFSKADLNQHVTEMGNIITSWVNRQIEEVANALMDLPTIYLYYPTFDRIFELDTVESTETEETATSSLENDWGMFNKVKNNSSVKSTVTSAEKGIAGIKGAYDTIKSLPFVTISREDIKIKYPSLDQKSFDALWQDLKDWKKNAQIEIQKTKEEWKEAFDGAGDTWEEILKLGECDASAADLSLECKHKLATVKVMLKTEKLLESIDKNLEIMETYANLPREIIKYKEGLLGYLTQVTCTLNQIMDLLGGWIVKNLIRYNLWKQFILTIQTILEGWEKLLDVMVNYKNSCETCKAETFQFNLWSILMSLIPSPPIIKFPRWPDIKIDLSQINANFEIELPRLHPIPEPIVFPKIPNLNLPGPPSVGFGLNFDLSFDLPGIPLLPALPALPKLPDLPSFNLPELPDLPPPPKIPEIPGSILGLLDLIDVLLQIYCLIKKGLWIYDEYTIKSTIEAMTSRPSGFMKLFDFLHLNFPDFSIAGYDLLVESQVNLEIDADYVTEAVKSAAKPWNSIVTNLVDEADVLKDELTDEIFDELDEKIDQADFIPDSLKENIQDELDKTDDKTDESVNDLGEKLQVQTIDSQTRNQHLLANISKEMQKAISQQSQLKTTAKIVPELESENLRRIKKIGKIVEDYQLELNQEIEKLKQTDDLDSIAYIPEYQPIQLVDKKIESETPAITRKTQYYASISQSEINKLQTSQSSKYLAQAIPTSINDLDQNNLQTSYGDNVESLDALPESSQNPSYNYQGAYIYDESTDQVQSLLKYEEESDSIKNLLYIDYDNDGDDDIVYSMGEDLYLKENYQISNKSFEPYPNEPQISDFDSLQNVFQAIKNYQVEKINNATVSISWNTSHDNNIGGYLIENVNIINQNVVSSKNYYYLVNTAEEFNVSVGGNPIQLGTSLVGPLGVQINNQLTLELKENETLYTSINDEEYYKFNLPNGFYYSSIYAIYTDGNISTRSEQRLLAPQIEADTMAPLITTPQKIEIYLNQTTVIPSDFFLDNSQNLVFDWSTDEPQLINSINNGLQIGPYTEPLNFDVNLMVADEAGNQTETQMEVNAIAPEISLNPLVLAEQKELTGMNTPFIENIPVTIYRERFGKTKIIKTESADSNSKYFTNAQGEYLVNDLSFDPGVTIKDSQNNQIAYIHATTGQIEIKENGYTKKVLSAVDALPTRVVILNANNKIVINQYFVADYNNDVSIDPFNINTDNVSGLEGVHIFDTNLEDKYQFESLPGNAPYYPGGAAIFDKTTQQSLILVNVEGKVHIPTTTEMNLVIKPSGTDEPVIFEIRDSANTLIGEIYIAIPIKEDLLEILPDKNWSQMISQVFVPLQKIAQPMFAALNSAAGVLPFTDINTDHPAYEAIKELYERQILTGYTDQTVRPDAKISRAEFVKIAIGATTCLDCTTPTEAEKNRYDASHPFPDIGNSAWYFYCVSKGKEKEMITGYGDGYFKPEHNISRAEAVAILLREADVNIEEMPTQYFLDVPEYAWYKDYVYTGVQLGIISANYSFVIPDEEITRGEFAMMAKKLLDLQDCRLIDTDLDGIPDYWEIQNGLNPANALDGALDPDNDGIPNSQEFLGETDPNQKEQCLYLNNPNQTDTDHDGIIDVCDDDIDNDLAKNLLGIYDQNGAIDSEKIQNSADNCVFIVNFTQLDTDKNGQGDECDPQYNDGNNGLTDGQGDTNNPQDNNGNNGLTDGQGDTNNPQDNNGNNGLTDGQGDANNPQDNNGNNGFTDGETNPTENIGSSSSEGEETPENSSSNSEGEDSSSADGSENEIDLCPSLPGNNQGCPDFSNGSDDLDNSDIPKDDSGVYIVLGDPTSCYFIDYAADLHKGDKVFSAVSSNDNKRIWTKSSVAQY